MTDETRFWFGDAVEQENGERFGVVTKPGDENSLTRIMWNDGSEELIPENELHLAKQETPDMSGGSAASLKSYRSAIVDMVNMLGAPVKVSCHTCEGCEYERIEAVTEGLVILGYMEPVEWEFVGETQNHVGGVVQNYKTKKPLPDPIKGWEKFMKAEFNIDLKPGWETIRHTQPSALNVLWTHLHPEPKIDGASVVTRPRIPRDLVSRVRFELEREEY